MPKKFPEVFVDELLRMFVLNLLKEFLNKLAEDFPETCLECYNNFWRNPSKTKSIPWKMKKPPFVCFKSFWRYYLKIFNKIAWEVPGKKSEGYPNKFPEKNAMESSNEIKRITVCFSYGIAWQISELMVKSWAHFSIKL